jgi:hypothetical protein
MSSFQPTFTGIFDTDLLILKEIDAPFLLIDLYHTNEYMHGLLNSKEALKIIAGNYELPIVHSFRELIEAYENKLIMDYPYEEVLDIAINYDNAKLLKKCLDTIEVPDNPPYEFTDEEEEFVHEYYDVVLLAAQKCIQQKSYNCLRAIGSYLIFAVAVEMSIDEDFDNGKYISKLLITAVDHNDYTAIDIVLSWNRDLIAPVDINLELDDVLQRAVETDNLAMYNYIIKKKEHGATHYSKDILSKAIVGKNPEMIRKVVDTYNERYFEMSEKDYRDILAGMTQLDFATKEYLDNFLSNFDIKTASGHTSHHISTINPSRSRFPKHF